MTRKDYKEAEVKLSKYRVSSGYYRVGDFVIYGGSPRWWQVRDEHDDLLEDFKTLREAIRYSLDLQRPRTQLIKKIIEKNSWRR